MRAGAISKVYKRCHRRPLELRSPFQTLNIFQIFVFVNLQCYNMLSSGRNCLLIIEMKDITGIWMHTKDTCARMINGLLICVSWTPFGSYSIGSKFCWTWNALLKDTDQTHVWFTTFQRSIFRHHLYIQLIYKPKIICIVTSFFNLEFSPLNKTE